MTEFASRKNIRMSPEIYKNGHVFFITIVTHKKHPWFEESSEFANFTVKTFQTICEERNTSLYAWCIMPDHIHLLLKDFDVVNFINTLKGKLTPVARNIDPTRKLWQRSFYDHALRKEEDLVEVSMYIWHNPVKKGLANNECAYLLSGSLVWPDWKEKFFGN